MAPSTLLSRKTREVNGSWPSPSSAPLCSSSDAIRSMSMSSGGRAIDRSTSQLIDSRRVVKADVPSSSKLIPSRSKSFSQKRSKSTEETADLITLESSSRYLLDHEAAAATPTFFDVFPDTAPAPAPAPLTIQLPKFQPLEGEGEGEGRAIDRSTSQLIDSRRVLKDDVPSFSQLIPSRSKSFSQKRSKSTEETADLITLESSSRYLLDHDAAAATSTFFDVFPDTAPAPAPLTIQPPKFQPLEGEVAGEGDASAVLRRPPSPEKQVVVLRVSLHCKGCARKVKKHISKMEGVTSFSVDLASKRVTVVGEVTPLGVLNSISKVKHAHFLQSVKPLPS